MTDTKPTLPPVAEETLSDFSLSLTGFEELAIAKNFDGYDPYRDGETKPIVLTRALVFVHLRRGGKSDINAHTEAMDMSFTRVTSYFTEESADEELAEELGLPPVTPAGEDGTSAA